MKFVTDFTIEAKFVFRSIFAKAAQNDHPDEASHASRFIFCASTHDLFNISSIIRRNGSIN